MTSPAERPDRIVGPPGDEPDLAAVVAAIEPDAGPRAVWRSLGRSGALRSVLRESADSLWLDPRRLSDLLLELDSRLSPGVVLSVCVQVATVLPLLRNAAAISPLAATVAERMLNGDTVVALAATDEGLSGSALVDSRTWALDSGDGVLVNGGKEWITNAVHCDYALVLTRYRRARHFTSYRWILVPSDAPGVSSRPATHILLAGSGLGHLSFDDVPLSGEHAIGQPGRALAELARQLAAERLASALWARAVCRRALADTHRYLRNRSTGDGSLWDNAAVRERFARCLMEMSRLDSMCDIICEIRARNGISAAYGMVLKASRAVVVDRILGECLNLRGADAFRDDGLARMREQFAMFGIAGGATGAMLAGIADHADELLRGAR